MKNSKIIPLATTMILLLAFGVAPSAVAAQTSTHGSYTNTFNGPNGGKFVVTFTWGQMNGALGNVHPDDTYKYWSSLTTIAYYNGLNQELWYYGISAQWTGDQTTNTVPYYESPPTPEYAVYGNCWSVTPTSQASSQPNGPSSVKFTGTATAICQLFGFVLQNYAVSCTAWGYAIQNPSGSCSIQ